MLRISKGGRVTVSTGHYSPLTRQRNRCLSLLPRNGTAIFASPAGCLDASVRRELGPVGANDSRLLQGVAGHCCLSTNAASQATSFSAVEDAVSRANDAVDDATEAAKATAGSSAPAPSIAALAKASAALAQDLTTYQLLLSLGQATAQTEGGGVSSSSAAAEALSSIFDGIRDARMLAATVNRVSTGFLVPLSPFKATIEGSSSSSSAALNSLLPMAAEILPFFPGITSLLNAILLFASTNADFATSAAAYQSLKDVAATKESLEAAVRAITRAMGKEGKKNKGSKNGAAGLSDGESAALQQLSSFFASRASGAIGTIDAIAANAWLRACNTAGKYSEASALLDSMLTKGLLVSPDSGTLAVAVDIASAQDDFQKATSLWLLFTIGQPPRRKAVSPLADAYRSYAYAAGKAGLRKEALAVVDRMRVAAPPASVFAACMRACVLTDKPQLAFSLFDDLMKYPRQEVALTEGLEEACYTLATAAAASPAFPSVQLPEEEALETIMACLSSSPSSPSSSQGYSAPSMRTWLALVHAAASRNHHNHHHPAGLARSRQWLERARATIKARQTELKERMTALTSAPKKTAKSSRELVSLQKELAADLECLKGCYEAVISALAVKGAEELSTAAMMMQAVPATVEMATAKPPTSKRASKSKKDLEAPPSSSFSPSKSSPAADEAEALFLQMMKEDSLPLPSPEGAVVALIRLRALKGDFLGALELYKQETGRRDVFPVERGLPEEKTGAVAASPVHSRDADGRVFLQPSLDMLLPLIRCSGMGGIPEHVALARCLLERHMQQGAAAVDVADAEALMARSDGGGGRSLTITPFSARQSSSSSFRGGSGGAAGKPRSVLLRPTLQVLNAYAAACADVGDSAEAASVLLRLHSVGLEPDRITFQHIIVAAVRANDLGTASEAVATMQGNGFELTPKAQEALQAAAAAEAARERKEAALRRKKKKQAKEGAVTATEESPKEEEAASAAGDAAAAVVPAEISSSLPSLEELQAPLSSSSVLPSEGNPLALLAKQRERLQQAKAKALEEQEAAAAAAAAASAREGLGDAANEKDEGFAAPEEPAEEAEPAPKKKAGRRKKANADSDAAAAASVAAAEDRARETEERMQRFLAGAEMVEIEEDDDDGEDALEPTLSPSQDQGNEDERPQLPLDLEVHLRSAVGLQLQYGLGGSPAALAAGATGRGYAAAYQQLSAMMMPSSSSSSSSSSSAAAIARASGLFGGSSTSSSWSLLSLSASSASSAAMGDNASSFSRNDASRSLLPMDVLVGGPVISNKNKTFQEKSYSGGFGRFPGVIATSPAGTSGNSTGVSVPSVPHLTLADGVVVPVPKGLRAKSEAEVRKHKLAGIRGDLMAVEAAQNDAQAEKQGDEEEEEGGGIQALQREIRYGHLEKKRLRRAQKFGGDGEIAATSFDEKLWPQISTGEQIAAAIKAGHAAPLPHPVSNDQAGVEEEKEDGEAAEAAADSFAAASSNVELERIRQKYAKTGGRRGRRLTARKHALMAVARGLAGPVDLSAGEGEGDGDGDGPEIPEEGLVDDDYPGEVVFDGDKPLYDGPLSDDDEGDYGDDDEAVATGTSSAPAATAVVRTPEKSLKEKKKAYARAFFNANSNNAASASSSSGDADDDHRAPNAASTAAAGSSSTAASGRRAMGPLGGFASSRRREATTTVMTPATALPSTPAKACETSAKAASASSPSLRQTGQQPQLQKKDKRGGGTTAATRLR